MRRALALLVLLLVAGCAKPKVTTTDHFLVDGPEPDIDAFADLLWADFQELNGSLVLIMEFENMSGRIPEFTAKFVIASSGDDTTWFLRTQANRSKPAPHIEYVVGRVEGTQDVVLEQVCAVTEITHEPWTIRIEAEHRITGLTQAGGTVRGLSIQTSDFEDHPMDSAETSNTFDVKGGTNPHDGCPLHAERTE